MLPGGSFTAANNKTAVFSLISRFTVGNYKSSAKACPTWEIAAFTEFNWPFDVSVIIFLHCNSFQLDTQV